MVLFESIRFGADDYFFFFVEAPAFLHRAAAFNAAIPTGLY